MAEGPAVNETLTPDDGADVLEGLLPAQTKSYELGLKLKLPQHVEVIHSKDIPADQYLPRILIEFLQQDRNGLARRVEAAHFPDTTSTHDVVQAETTTDTTESAGNTTAGDDEGVKSKPFPQLNPANVTAVETEIKGLHERRTTPICRETVKTILLR
ncbi:hypothetical protein GBAR_LOCUS29318 [Geodia barretti]|uniref:Uncharacterized protein n=1 Tax=Geodia barretti TaxID=519541 RepID=A0AA35XDN8_GEOBA|nr:hypothetical protein GBAR_LOCUS29318 [Geodia barretti]